VLELVDVDVSFGGLKAVDGLSFEVRSGEILGIIGPNGSGKSTVFNTITGVVKPERGTVTFNDEDITGLPSHRIAHKGIARTFQTVRPFPHLTALDNVMAGRLFGGEGASRNKRATIEARAILDRVGLGDKAEARADSFTIMERKWLEVGRALAGGPRLVLLDEFMAGISPGEVSQAVDLVKSINADGVTIVIVEHIVKAITDTCDRVVVLDAGSKLAEGSVAEIVGNREVIAAYLGSSHAQG
jgi:branched-chain amino acid transport system ATP-binding protein